MQYAAVMAELEAKGSETRRAAAKKHGATLPAFGTTIAQRRAIAKRVGVDQPLARQLWATANHDARALATLVADAAQMSPVELDVWAGELECGALAELFADLAARGPSAKNHLARWIGSPHRWTARAGWHVLARFAEGGAEGDGYFKPHVDRIHASLPGAPGDVRPAMTRALGAIGERSAALAKHARKVKAPPPARGSEVVSTAAFASKKRRAHG